MRSKLRPLKKNRKLFIEKRLKLLKRIFNNWKTYYNLKDKKLILKDKN